MRRNIIDTTADCILGIFQDINCVFGTVATRRGNLLRLYVYCLHAMSRSARAPAKHAGLLSLGSRRRPEPVGVLVPSLAWHPISALPQPSVC
jgi:hypothetical protein